MELQERYEGPAPNILSTSIYDCISTFMGNLIMYTIVSSIIIILYRNMVFENVNHILLLKDQIMHNCST